MKTKYTPGPWTPSNFNTGFLKGADGDGVAIVCDSHRSRAEQIANAQLIAAVPEAVSLMEDLQEYLCEHGGPAVELLERLDAWLAKATGADTEMHDDGTLGTAGGE